jgi:hypothetical protein
MRGPVIMATLLTALPLAGCTQTTSSNGGFRGEEAAVAQKVADLADDGRKKRAADICGDVLAKPLVDQVAAAGSSCAAEMKKAIDDADGFQLDVTDVTVTANRATAKVQSRDRGQNVTRTFSFIREDGGWRISDFG